MKRERERERWRKGWGERSSATTTKERKRKWDEQKKQKSKRELLLFLCVWVSYFFSSLAGFLPLLFFALTSRSESPFLSPRREPSQQRTLDNLPPELRCRNFPSIITDWACKSVPKVQKTCVQRVHVPTELPFLHATRCWLGLIFPNFLWKWFFFLVPPSGTDFPTTRCCPKWQQLLPSSASLCLSHTHILFLFCVAIQTCAFFLGLSALQSEGRRRRGIKCLWDSTQPNKCTPFGSALHPLPPPPPPFCEYLVIMGSVCPSSRSLSFAFAGPFFWVWKRRRREREREREPIFCENQSQWRRLPLLAPIHYYSQTHLVGKNVQEIFILLKKKFLHPTRGRTERESFSIWKSLHFSAFHFCGFYWLPSLLFPLLFFLALHRETNNVSTSANFFLFGRCPLLRTSEKCRVCVSTPNQQQ